MNNRQKFKELLPLIKAFSEGENIEYQSCSGAWMTLTDATNVFYADTKYRKKPEKELRPVAELRLVRRRIDHGHTYHFENILQQKYQLYRENQSTDEYEWVDVPLKNELEDK